MVYEKKRRPVTNVSFQFIGTEAMPQGKVVFIKYPYGKFDINFIKTAIKQLAEMFPEKKFVFLPGEFSIDVGKETLEQMREQLNQLLDLMNYEKIMDF